MHQFFIKEDQIFENRIKITGKDVNHIRQVLRMRTGDEVSLIADDYKTYQSEIEEIQTDLIWCRILEQKEEMMELTSRIYLFQGLPKADKMELIIQKAVELGVFAVIPVATKRAIVKLEGKKEEAKINRWQQISEAAAKQSKRNLVPEILPIMSFSDALKFVKDFSLKMIPYELSDNIKDTKKMMEDLRGKDRIAVFIGPEGGFEEDEIKKAQEAGVHPISLGKRILRTETAGMTVLAWIMYQLEGTE